MIDAYQVIAIVLYPMVLSAALGTILSIGKDYLPRKGEGEAE